LHRDIFHALGAFSATSIFALEEPDVDVLLHPRLPQMYKHRIERLERVLEGPEQGEAREIVRSMIDAVILTRRPDRSGLDATLVGALAALLSVCAAISGNKKPSAAGPSEGQLSVVAGARYQRHLADLKCRLQAAKPSSGRSSTGPLEACRSGHRDRRTWNPIGEWLSRLEGKARPPA
jgi:hypothetical protein